MGRMVRFLGFGGRVGLGGTEFNVLRGVGIWPGGRSLDYWLVGTGYYNF